MTVASILASLKSIMAQIKGLVATENLPTPQGDQILRYITTQLGQDASPSDLAPDELGCAETVTTLLKHLFPRVSIVLSTAQLFDYLKASVEFSQVFSPLPGDVIISPTGFGGFNGVNHGHTGFVGLNGTVLSNDSASGKFLQNYTLETWRQRYSVRGGYPVLFFRRILA